MSVDINAQNLAQQFNVIILKTNGPEMLRVSRPFAMVVCRDAGDEWNSYLRVLKR